MRVLQGIWDRILKAADIQKHLTAHGMRRTFNNLARRAQVDRVVLHATIGHSSDAMTEHYSFVDAQEKMRAVDAVVRMVQSDQRSPNRSPDSGNGPPTEGGPQS